MIVTFTSKAKEMLLNRLYKGTPDYSAPSTFSVGDATNLFPIEDGVVNDDGSNQLTGGGAGTNTTDSTSIYKSGASQTDNTAQNLPMNATSDQKWWIYTPLGTKVDSTKYLSCWLYIKDQDALDMFLDAGTAFQLIIGSGAVHLYAKNFEKTDLTTGWNWLTTYPDAVEDLPVLIGAPDNNNLDYFTLLLYTNNAADIIPEGDLIYDLLRSYDDDDLTKEFVSGYPAFYEAELQASIRTYLDVDNATGFNISTFYIYNEETVSSASFTAESKGTTDEFVFVITYEVEQ